MRIALVVLLLLALVPGAAAQAQPVTRCQRECDPRGDDMNGRQPLTEGPLRVILYAAGQTLLTPKAPKQVTAWVPTGSGGFPPRTQPPHVDTCVNIHWSTRWDSGPSLVWGSDTGLAAPLRVVGPVAAYFYVQAVNPVGYGTPSPVPPPLTVRARLQAGAPTEDGIVLAEGETSYDAAATAPYPVWEYRVPLRLAHTTWGEPERPAITIFAEFCEVDASAARTSHGPWRLVGSPELPTRLVFGLVRPFEDPQRSVEKDGSRLQVTFRVRPVLGAADTDYGSWGIDYNGRMRLERPRASVVVSDGRMSHLQLVWTFKDSVLNRNATTHAFAAYVENLQQTFLHRDQVQFEGAHAFSASERAPAPSWLLALAVVACAIVLARRSTRRPRR